MLEKSQEYFRLAMAAAALLVGLSVAYHYVIYIPAKDRARQAAEETKTVKLAQEKEAKQKADAKSAQERRANYRICVSNAQFNYEFRWNGLCRKKSEEADTKRSQCMQNGFAEDYCRSTYPPSPPSDCLLPRETSRNYTDDMEADKRRCLEEARSGVLDVSEFTEAED